jgi:hypothetical protein
LPTLATPCGSTVTVPLAVVVKFVSAPEPVTGVVRAPVLNVTARWPDQTSEWLYITLSESTRCGVALKSAVKEAAKRSIVW